MFWRMFWRRSDEVRLKDLEDRIVRLEGKITSAADLLDATERMDRIIKRSFRLNSQLAQLENQNQKEASAENAAATISRRSDLLRRLS